MQDRQVRSLGREDPPEEGMAAHSSVLAWRIPWTEEPGDLLPIRFQRVGHDWSNFAHMHTRGLEGELAPGSSEVAGFQVARVGKSKHLTTTLSCSLSFINWNQPYPLLGAWRCFTKCVLNCSVSGILFRRQYCVQSGLLGSWHFQASVAGVFHWAGLCLRAWQLLFVCRVSAEDTFRFWRRPGHSIHETLRLRTWALASAHVRLANSSSLPWQREGKCHLKSGLELEEGQRRKEIYQRY